MVFNATLRNPSSFLLAGPSQVESTEKFVEFIFNLILFPVWENFVDDELDSKSGFAFRRCEM